MKRYYRKQENDETEEIIRQMESFIDSQRMPDELTEHIELTEEQAKVFSDLLFSLRHDLPEVCALIYCYGAAKAYEQIKGGLN